MWCPGIIFQCFFLSVVSAEIGDFAVAKKTGGLRPVEIHDESMMASYTRPVYQPNTQYMERYTVLLGDSLHFSKETDSGVFSVLSVLNRAAFVDS